MEPLYLPAIREGKLFPVAAAVLRLAHCSFWWVPDWLFWVFLILRSVRHSLASFCTDIIPMQILCLVVICLHLLIFWSYWSYVCLVLLWILSTNLEFSLLFVLCNDSMFRKLHCCCYCHLFQNSTRPPSCFFLLFVLFCFVCLFFFLGCIGSLLLHTDFL